MLSCEIMPQASEGIDFTDANARGVLLVGIPYPNARDTKVGASAWVPVHLSPMGGAGCGESLQSELRHSQRATGSLTAGVFFQSI